MSESQKLLILAACITEPDYGRFKRYSEVMMVDGTHDTNEEKRELFITTVKDRYNRVFCLSRCLLPNSRTMIFHWQFSIFYKIHLPQHIRDKVCLIICDGDKNECSQIDFAIKSGLFPNALRVRCIWHIVDRGWMNHKPSPQLVSTDATVVKYNEEKYATLLKDESKFIKDWCYSFGKA